MKNKDEITAAITSSEATTEPETKMRTIDEERLPPKVKGEEGNDKIVHINEKEQDKLFNALGTRDHGLVAHFFRQLHGVSAFTDENQVSRLNTALAIMHGIKPRDELEAMLVVQMIGVHNLAMSFMGRAIIPEQTFDGVEACVNRSTRLLRTFTAQIEALSRYRGGGQQKVTVEHVHVNEGGQAIVGTVEGGGGKL